MFSRERFLRGCSGELPPAASDVELVRGDFRFALDDLRDEVRLADAAEFVRWEEGPAIRKLC